MQEDITPHSIANEIRMLRSSFFGSFLVVEGITDAKVYGHFTSVDCQIEIAFNKENAIEVIEILNDDSFVGALAIIDADFDLLENKEYDLENLFLTDFHDLECIIFASPALEKVLAEFGSKSKIMNMCEVKTIRDLLLEIGCFVGYLRWVSITEKLHLTFEEIDFGKFTKKQDLSFDLDKLITTVKNKSQQPSLNNKTIIEMIDKLKSDKHDKLQVTCGKDVIEILSIALQKVLGTNNSNKVTSEIIARDLRLAYEFEFFTTTDLYKNIKIWEDQNEPFVIFR